MFEAMIPKSHSKGQGWKKKGIWLKYRSGIMRNLTRGMKRTGMEPAGATADGKAFLCAHHTQQALKAKENTDIGRRNTRT